jgi:apolipoprotein N-acyltransferase
VSRPPERLRILALCVGSGLALCGSMPPVGFWPLAAVAFVGIDRLIADRARRPRFARGWLVGMSLYVPGLLWMRAMTLPGYLIACALYAAMLAAALALVPSGPARWPALVGAWTLAELVRWSWPFGGVPLANLAIGQVSGPLAPVARVGGALLLVAVTVLAGQAVAAALRGWGRPAAAMGLVVLAAVAVADLAPRGHDVGSAEVALVQGGGEQGTRKEETGIVAPFEHHVAATALVRPPVDLVVWPEDVIDTQGAFVDDPWFDTVAALARRLGAPMVVGTVEGAGPEHYRNAAVLVDRDGVAVDRYDKVHRVPFGEYTPLRSLLEPIAGDALGDRDLLVGQGRGELDVPGVVGRASVAVSWEVFFSDRVREGVRDGGRIVLNPTNGSSFTGTIVQSQQVASSRLRALESGRWVLQVAPTGFSAVVDDHGRVLARTAVSERRVLQQQVRLREGLTWFATLGLAPALCLAAACLVWARAWSRRLRRAGHR